MTILTDDEFRTFVTTPLGDDPLQVLLDAAEFEILREAGTGGVELFDGGARLVSLARAAASVTSITETSGSTVTTLATDDYLVHPGGYLIERLNTGTHGRSRWWGRVTVTYTSADDEALRKAVQVDLVNLMLTYQPGVTSETVGAWTRQLAGNSAWNNDEERRAILSRLTVHPLMVVVG